MSSIFLKFRNMKHDTPKKSVATGKKVSRQPAATRRAALLDVPAVQAVCSAADIGRQVRANRSQQGLRIDDAAALCGVSVDLMSRLENGVASVRLDKLMSVLYGIGLTLLIAPKGHDYVRHLPQDRVLGITSPMQTVKAVDAP